jgi:hypothetical protein
VFDEKALLRPRVLDGWERQVSRDDHVHPAPWHAVALAASPKVIPPAHFDMMPECSHRLDIGRHGEVGVIAFQHRGQPLTPQVDVPMPDALQFKIDFPQRRPPLLVLGPAPELKAASVPLRSATVRKAKEIERFRPSFSARFSIFGNKPAELD